jgi:hypothetical protein
MEAVKRFTKENTMTSKPFPPPKRPFSCPESILFIHPDATAMEVDIDMLSCIISRSLAMIEMLAAYYQTPVEHRSGSIKDSMIDDYLWQLSGNMQLVRQILETSPERIRSPMVQKNH